MRYRQRCDIFTPVRTTTTTSTTTTTTTKVDQHHKMALETEAKFAKNQTDRSGLCLLDPALVPEHLVQGKRGQAPVGLDTVADVSYHSGKNNYTM